MSDPLAGQTVIVTAAAGPGARPVIETLLAAGASLVLWDGNPEALEALCADLPIETRPMVVQLDKPDQVRGALAGASGGASGGAGALPIAAVIALRDGPVLREGLAARAGTRDVPVLSAADLGGDPVAAVWERCHRH